MSSSDAVTFPEGFLWGAATASYQIEGAVKADGRGVSIWDTFSHATGRTHNGDTGDVACDHYGRLQEDLDLISSLGLGAYRFSVAWPRIQPDGRGRPNQAGVDFYRRLVDGLRERGVVPAATLYHWDLPQALEDSGGWVSRDTAMRFGEYVALVAEALGDSVGLWITLNEPWCSAWLGYARAVHAPGRSDIGAALAAHHHLLVGHGEAVQALRSRVAGQVGITLNLAPIRAASEHPDDLAAARRVDGNANRMFLDPIFRGSYPADMAEHYSSYDPGLSVALDGDAATIAQPLDFLGVNFYSPQFVADPGRLDEARAAGFVVRSSDGGLVGADLRAHGIERPDQRRTAMGWEVDAEALGELLGRLRRDYGQFPIYITENGAATHDYVDPEGRVIDHDRISYIDEHLRALGEVIEAGVDVRGYFVWSLMDNFEWALGYSRRFGLVWVDYPTGTRIPKASFAWYREVAAANGLKVDHPAG